MQRRWWRRIQPLGWALMAMGAGLVLLLVLLGNNPSWQLKAVFNPMDALRSLWRLLRPAAELLALALVTLPLPVLLLQWLLKRLPPNVGRQLRGKGRRKRHRHRSAQASTPPAGDRILG